MRVASKRSLGLSHFTSGLLVQPTQVRLPTNGNSTRKDISKLRRHVHETEGSDGWPKLNTVGDTNGESLLEAFKGFFKCGARKKGVQAEKVGVEDGSETDLLDHDFGQDREELG